MTPQLPTVAECKSMVRRDEWSENQFELVMAANWLMKHCETDPAITVDDGLACLDHQGVVAEIGARILYVLTGRDGLGWHGAGYNGLPFHVEKQNWLDYLASQSMGGEQ
ncbi:MAG: hypothetical protein AAGG48_28685 [Planctomycetota bacterium]